VLELAYRADSNSAAREGLWVRVPPAVPPGYLTPDCVAAPPDRSDCADARGLGCAYPYLLGLYLGDGMLSPSRRGVWRLRISLDAKYPGIIERAKAAIHDVAGRSVGEVRRPGCVEVYGYWKHWVCLFPQHGPGPKHTRPVALADWQTWLSTVHPEALLAGLIHSDGCRCVNQVKGHEYPRYFFSNLSDDIRATFVWACSLVGVDCRADGPRNVSVARRDSVAILDQFVGPKR
jgi:hypothetical protein